MTDYKDEKRGTWFANFRYKDWRGESKQKSKRGFRTKRDTPYTATHLNTLCSQLSAIMNYSVRFYSLERNPVQIAGKVGSKERREMNVWTQEQYLRFSDAVADKPYSRIAFEMLFWCGLRVGEMLALTPSDIDFETSQIHIIKSFGRVGGMDVINPPKISQSNRVVTMPSFLAEEIEEYLKMHAKAKPDARIFPTMTKYLLHHEITRGSKATGFKRIHIHDLRHSHAIMLVEMGMSVSSITARLAHSGKTVTHRYLYLLPGFEAANARKLGTMML